MLIFKELSPALKSSEPPTAADGKRAARGDARRVQELDIELATTRDQLHTAIDELETANEEMKSANEEYQSVNEELQSSNEELETSKEEMQSINEELQTVNVELNSKNEALGRLNSDLQNLLESTQIATLFLDSSLHVSGFTPAISDLFHLREGDHGRPITEITARIPYAQLTADVKQVLRTLAMIERVLPGGVDGSVYLLRMRPYRTTDNVIDGVVLTFIDITERQQLEYERGRLAAIVTSSQDAIIGHATDGLVTSWNASAERMFGTPAARAIGHSLSTLLRSETEDDRQSQLATNAGEAADERLMTLQIPDGTPLTVSVRSSPVLDSNGAVIGGSTIARDVTDRERLLGELNHRVKNTLATVQAIATQTLANAADLDAFKSDFFARLHGLSRSHDLLAKESWRGADLAMLVNEELAPYASGRDARPDIAGDAVRLSAREALALGMALHELATNAAKHGAFSLSGGNVRVRWKVRPREGARWLELHWDERDGPAVETPSRRGFGTRLLNDGIRHELGGRVNLDFVHTGLSCTIEFPLREGSMT